MDDRSEAFVAVFQSFLEEVVGAHRRAAPAGAPALIPALAEHLGADPHQLPVVTEEIRSHLYVDLDIALGLVQETGGSHRLLGLGGGEQRRHSSLSEILESAGRYGQFPLGAVDYISIATGPDTTRQAVAFGLRLFTYDGAPVVVLQRSAEPRVRPRGGPDGDPHAGRRRRRAPDRARPRADGAALGARGPGPLARRVRPTSRASAASPSTAGRR